VLAGAALLAAAPGALAQDPGVTIDQDSPSAKEYEIPLESVRRGAVPGADTSAPVVPGERGAAPLFGAGVTKRGATRSPGKRSSPSGGGRRAAIVPEPAVVQAAASSPGAPDGGAGTAALIVGSGALVLALGAGAGVLLRRRSSRP
jgi:hypothetical protein